MYRKLALFSIASLLPIPAAFAQVSRVAGRVDNNRTFTLRGRVHPAANVRNDRGAVDPSFTVPGITLLLKPSAAQQSDLEKLLLDQQDPSSPNYHQWLTPEQYADRFGASNSDVQQLVAWAQSQGFQVAAVGRSRTFISLRGTAQQVQSAFHTEIHRYAVNGQPHFSNATDPAIPAAFSNLVSGILGLNDFHPKPRLKRPAQPEMNSGAGRHNIAPDDFAAIYNVAPLYAAGVDGTGQNIAIVGQSNIKTSDIAAFRAQFNLSPANLTTKLVGSTDPGISPGDVDESNLDIEWTGAVARNANIIFYYSTDVWQSAMYAVDDNQASVLSMSYGGCEAADLFDLPNFRAVVQRANAQGMTWFAASGDQGAADCEDQTATIAQNGLAVDVPAAIPEVTAMGGTEFNESGGSYWNSTESSTHASAAGYIPEVAWNDTVAGTLGFAATGGGTSIYFPQPAWQTGPGVPTDGFRHVPDLALSSSADHDGYWFYSTGSRGFVGGTSVAAPTMAGIFTLLNHYLVSTGAIAKPGLGNVNPAIYRLAQTASGIFHDVTDGNNSVPCAGGTPNCSNGFVGLAAGPAYDLVTGWGSVDAYNLVHGWTSSPAVNSLVEPSIDQNPVFQTPGSGWKFNLTLTEEAGVGTTLTDFTIDGVSHASEIATLLKPAAIPPRASVSFPYSLSNVAVPKNVVFGFAGVDAAGVAWTRQLSVPFSGPQVHLSVAGVSNAATGQQVFAPGMIMSVYGTAMGNFAQSAAAVPLPQYLAGFEAFVNDVPAPLYFVSPNQVNIQIPYETSPGRATLNLGNPWENINYRFTVTAAAPGIFTFPDGSVNPSRAASGGQTVTMFITGEGQVTPAVTTGSTPSGSRMPQPRQPVTVTVGGLPATVQSIGIPSWSVGVTQVNFTVPAGLAPGVQQVIVTVGTAASPPANITINQ